MNALVILKRLWMEMQHIFVVKMETVHNVDNCIVYVFWTAFWPDSEFGSKSTLQCWTQGRTVLNHRLSYRLPGDKHEPSSCRTLCNENKCWMLRVTKRTLQDECPEPWVLGRNHSGVHVWPCFLLWRRLPQQRARCDVAPPAAGALLDLGGER